jgi:hypothetical protein
MMPHRESAADRYAARVDAVLAQRTRLRGPQPPGDKRAACPADHPLVTADPLRPMGPNLAVIASYIEADDVIIDIGGGAGRMSLPLAFAVPRGDQHRALAYHGHGLSDECRRGRDQQHVHHRGRMA